MENVNYRFRWSSEPWNWAQCLGPVQKVTRLITYWFDVSTDKVHTLSSEKDHARQMFKAHTNVDRVVSISESKYWISEKNISLCLMSRVVGLSFWSKPDLLQQRHKTSTVLYLGISVLVEIESRKWLTSHPSSKTKLCLMFERKKWFLFGFWMITNCYVDYMS